MKKFILTNLFLISILSMFAQGTSPEQVKVEIEKATAAEQEAFREGDCTTVIAFMDDDITFFANGMMPPKKEMIERFCQNIPRPFPAQNKTKESFSISPLSANAAFTVRTLEYEKNEGILIKEVVTKIWNRKDDGWKIVHFQSTVREFPKPAN